MSEAHDLIFTGHSHPAIGVHHIEAKCSCDASRYEATKPTVRRAQRSIQEIHRRHVAQKRDEAIGQEDELEPYVTEALRDPAFRVAYEEAGEE